MKFSNLLSKNTTDKSKLIIALFGGGGKTSLLYQLGIEFTQQYNRVLLTSIVKAGPSPDIPIVLSKPKNSIENLFVDHQPLYLLKEKISTFKYKGFESIELRNFYLKTDITIFESDGSRNLPLKVHSEWDPVIPDFATHVIIVIGADVINTKLVDGKVHRPGQFKSLWEIEDDTLIDIPLITKVVTDKKGYLSKIPEGIKTVYFVNKANTYHGQASNLAHSIRSKSNASVFYGNVLENWWKQVK